jgi:hypothetical protein
MYRSDKIYHVIVRSSFWLAGKSYSTRSQKYHPEPASLSLGCVFSRFEKWLKTYNYPMTSGCLEADVSIRRFGICTVLCSFTVSAVHFSTKRMSLSSFRPRISTTTTTLANVRLPLCCYFTPRRGTPARKDSSQSKP